MAARTAVVAGTATAVSGRVARRQQQKYSQEGQQQEMEAAPAEVETDYAAEIEKLAQMKAQGLITDEEFEAKKKQILGI